MSSSSQRGAKRVDMRGKGWGLTRHEYILVMLYEVFDDALGVLDDINISPVDPRVLRLQRGAEQEVPGLAHSLPPGALEFERVPHSNILTLEHTVVLLHDSDTVERTAQLRVGLVLDTVQLGSEDSQGIIGRVGDQEREIDEFVGIRQLRNELKVLGQVVRGVSEGSEHQYPLLVLGGVAGR